MCIFVILWLVNIIVKIKIDIKHWSIFLWTIVILKFSSVSCGNYDTQRRKMLFQSNPHSKALYNLQVLYRRHGQNSQNFLTRICQIFWCIWEPITKLVFFILNHLLLKTLSIFKISKYSGLKLQKVCESCPRFLDL